MLFNTSQPQKQIRREGRKGYIAPNIGAYASLAIVANTMYGFRWYQPNTMPLNSVTFYVQTQSTANDAMDFVIFDSAGTTEIIRVTAKAGLLNSTGIKTLTGGTDYTVPTLQGNTIYQVCYASPNTANLVIWSKTVGGGTVNTLMGSTVPDLEMFSKTTSYPIPASLSGVSAIAQAPIFGLLES